jgi:hypothetical protein
MNYCQPYVLSPDETIVAAWDCQLTQAGEDPCLAEALAHAGNGLFQRFATCYAQLRALPRGARRALQRQLARSQELAAIPPEWQFKLARSLAGAALLLALGHGVAQSATITVTTNIPTIAADGKCSIVEAIINANNNAATHTDCAAGSGADTIVLPAASVHTILSDYNSAYGATRLPAITTQITIQGNGSIITRKKSKALSRLIAVTTTGNLTLDRVTLSGGGQYHGGAIINYGSLTITNSTISGNVAIKGGGIANGAGATLDIDQSTLSKNAAAYGGAIFDDSGEVSISNSIITGNRVVIEGGGLYDRSGTVLIENTAIDANRADAGGGLFIVASILAIDNTRISGNSASSHGGGMWIAGGFSNHATVTIENSTITGNKGHFSAGGILHQNFGGTLTIQNSAIFANTAGDSGGGVNQTSGSMTVENSTVSGNKAGSEGGGIWTQNILTVANSTISGNSAKSGGGVYSLRYELTLHHSLISGNKASVGTEIHRLSTVTTVADDFNLFGLNGNAGVVGFTPGASDIVPGAGVLIGNILAPLANNGGPTQTHALVPGSPAIDAAPVDADCPATDQRGVTRPQGPLCDIGSFEK